jgi:hypothetical protein
MYVARICPFGQLASNDALISILPCTLGTGEHGVGIGKTEYLVKELGEDTVELMKTVKRAIDPLNLFNPGKVCDMFQRLL